MTVSERGVALLEVLVALTMLGVAGPALLGALDAGVQASHEMARREREVIEADQLMTSMTLLSRADLDRRIGSHDVGTMMVTIQRPNPTLYRIAVSTRAHEQVEALVTVVYRPASAQ